MDRRNRAGSTKRALKPIVYAGGALVLVVGGAALTFHQLDGSATSASQQTSTTSAATTSPSTTAAPTTTLGSAKSSSTFGAVPSGFYPSSATFVSATDAFALGGVPCSSSSTGWCAELAASTDTGATWTAAPLSGIPLDPRFTISKSSPATNGVSMVRFLNQSVGYAFGPALYLTTDGGASWTQLSVPGISGLGTSEEVSSLEIGGGTATAVVLPTGTTGQSYLITAQVSSSPQSFSVETPPATLSGFGGYFRNSLGEIVYGLRTSPGAYFRAAGSSSWTALTSPCVAKGIGGTLGSLYLNGSSEGIVAGCTLGVAAGSSQKEIDLSTNGGNSWQTLSAPPFPGDMSAVAAGSSSDISVAAVSGASFVYSSTNGGKSWSTFNFGTSALASGGYPVFDLGYTTATQAFCILGSPGDATGSQSQSQMYLTGNGGATWNPVTF
ncbi:MAG: hypothetical protein M0000_08265 [Actinomycetota bacterium]|nr:hypothetical protein [Actinomycetota bacterium]